jgi:hypothetical protein
MSKTLDSSKYLRPATLPEIPDSTKRARIYPLWPHRFISVPEWWVIVAPQVSDKSPWPIVVGLILWQQYRLNRGKQPLKLTGPMRRKFGIKRDRVRRALTALEKAGLITMQRFKHRSPLITLMTGQKDG